MNRFVCFECKVKIRKSHKELYNCSQCGLMFCGSHVYSYVDGNNRAITKNAPLKCTRCMNEDEGKKLDSLIELTNLFPDDFKIEVLEGLSKLTI